LSYRTFQIFSSLDSGFPTKFSHYYLLILQIFPLQVPTTIFPPPPEKINKCLYLMLSPGTPPGITRPSAVASRPPGTAASGPAPPYDPAPRRCGPGGTEWKRHRWPPPGHPSTGVGIRVDIRPFCVTAVGRLLPKQKGVKAEVSIN
jgi:hypothetical protein